MASTGTRASAPFWDSLDQNCAPLSVWMPEGSLLRSSLITPHPSRLTVLSQELDHPRIIDKRESGSGDLTEEFLSKTHGKRQGLPTPKGQKELLEQEAVEGQVGVSD